MSLDEQLPSLEKAQSLFNRIEKNTLSALQAAKNLGCSVNLDGGTPTLLLALSGGPDSSALLLALHSVAERGTIKLNACHINHGLRGPDSAADQEYCQMLCARLGVPLQVRSVSGGQETAAAPKWSEADLRDGRYSALSAVAHEIHCNIIAVGHTLDDQAETLLFRFLRGTSLPGLTGIKSARMLNSSQCLIRPMLDIPRRECTELLLDQGIQARHDKSNDDIRYTRNFIRHQLMPLINSRFSGFRERLEHFRIIAKDENDFLEDLAVRRYEQWRPVSSLQEFAQIEPALRRRILVLCLEERGIEVSFERIDAILLLMEAAQPGKEHALAYSLNGRWDVRVSGDRTLIWVDKSQASGRRDLGQFGVKVPGSIVIPALGRAFVVERLDSGEYDQPNHLDNPDKNDWNPAQFGPTDCLSLLVDLTDLSIPLSLRQRQPGDVIQPFGMQEKVRLKKFLHTHKGRSHEETLLLVDARGEVLWVPGVGISELLRVQKQKRPTHRLTWTELAPCHSGLA